MKNPALRTWHPLAHSGITESSQSVLWAVGAWDTTKNYMLWMWRWRGTCPALLCSHHHQYCVVITPAKSRHGYRGGRGTEERSHQGGDVWSWRSNWKGGDEGEGRWTRAGVHSEPATLWWPPSPMSTWWIDPCSYSAHPTGSYSHVYNGSSFTEMGSCKLCIVVLWAWIIYLHKWCRVIDLILFLLSTQHWVYKISLRLCVIWTIGSPLLCQQCPTKYTT